MTWTQLHDACEHDDVKNVIDLARNHSDDAFKADDHGYTPLHIMCWGNPNPQAVEALLQACPQAVTDQDVHGDTPLHIACCCTSTDKHLVQMLLTASPTAASIPNKEGLMAVHMACRHAPNNEGVIGLLIDVYPYALCSHIKVGNPAPHKQAEPLTGSKAAYHAIFDPTAGMGSKDSVALRFDGASKQVRDGAYPLHMAIAAGAPLSVVEMLIKEESAILLKTNKYLETPLHLALLNHAPEEMIQVLVQTGSSALNMRDAHGKLPIHSAAAVGSSVHVFKCLIESFPASIHEITFGTGLAPLDIAIAAGKCTDEVLRLLQISDRAL